MINYIQSITEAELRFIASSDYGSESDIHYDALRKVIFDQSCILSMDQSWNPGNVISLCSHYPTPKCENVFCICICLVLLNRGVFELTDKDLQVRFDENESLYSSLDSRYTKIILDAFAWAGF